MLPCDPHTSVRAQISFVLLGTRQTSVPNRTTQYPVQIQETNGNTYAWMITFFSIRRSARKIDVQIFVEAPADGDFRGRRAGRAIQRAPAPCGQIVAVFRYVDVQLAPLIIFVLP